jgi:hypothetical protein
MPRRFEQSNTEENSVVAERVGFEPTVRFDVVHGPADRRVRYSGPHQFRTRSDLSGTQRTREYRPQISEQGLLAKPLLRRNATLSRQVRWISNSVLWKLNALGHPPIDRSLSTGMQWRNAKRFSVCESLSERGFRRHARQAGQTICFLH